MSRATKIVIQNLGVLIHIPGVMALISVPLAFGMGERFAIVPFLWTAVISVGLGQALYRLCHSPGEPSLYLSMIIAALGWLVVPIISTLPFLLISHSQSQIQAGSESLGAFGNPLNATFEAFSGFTSTGLTMAMHPAELPYSLHWWRSFMQWVGGVGVILVMLSIRKPSISSLHLFEAEARTHKILPSVIATARTIWWIYLLFTVASVVCLRLVGVDWWESINHGMAGIATGGFTVTDSSLSNYGTGPKVVMMAIMVVGAVSFSLHYQVLKRRRWSVLIRDQQHKALWVFLIVGTVLILAENWLYHGDPVWLDSAFQWISALSTAGYQTVDVNEWSPTVKLLLSVGMLLGGAAGSTAGGLKQERIVHLLASAKCVFRAITRTAHQVYHFEVDGTRITEDSLNRLGVGAGILSLLWLGVTGLGVLILAHFVPAQFGLGEIIYEVASAQSNVGLSTGITSPELPWMAKTTLMLLMWVGRLEIFPVMVLLGTLFRIGRTESVVPD